MQASKRRMVIMAPGTWNGLKYSKKAIVECFKKTNWDNLKDITLEFDLSKVVGTLKDVRIDEAGVVTGLPVFFDENVKKIYDVKIGGLAPAIVGKPKNNEFKEFEFRSISFVKSPAIKSKKKLKGDKR